MLYKHEQAFYNKQGSKNLGSIYIYSKFLPREFDKWFHYLVESILDLDHDNMVLFFCLKLWFIYGGMKIEKGNQRK